MKCHHKLATLSSSPVFSVSLVYYLATVDLAHSVPDHVHRVATWVIVSADLAWGPQIMARMVVVQWSGQSGGPAGPQATYALCMSSLPLELGCGLETAEGRDGGAGHKGLHTGPKETGERHWLPTQSNNPQDIASPRERAKGEAPALRTGQISLTYLWYHGL